MVHGANSVNGADKAQTATRVNYNINDADTQDKSQNSVMTKKAMKEGKKGYDAGQKVAADLIGYTTDAEQYEVQNRIKQDVNSQNVTNFLKGYEDYYNDVRGFHPFQLRKEIGGDVPDHFFEQLYTENGFENNHALMKNVATKLMKNFDMCGANKQAQQIKEILTHKSLTKEDAKVLDKLSQEAIKYAN